LFTVSEILRKIGIDFISDFLLKARVLIYRSLNTKFSIFKKEITLKNGEAICSRYQRHYRDFEHAYVY